MGINLFSNKEFISHSGSTLPWKIECDTLVKEDWDWAATLISKKLSFQEVYGIPRGGKEFESSLIPYKKPRGKYYLIVDDVYTTGDSMETVRRNTITHLPILGMVLFARDKTPSWIKAIWNYATYL